MFHFFGTLAVAYLAGTGNLTNAALVGRGLVRAARKLLNGNYQGAGVEAVAALAAPAVVGYGVVAGLVMDVVDAAADLAGGVLPRHELPRPRLVAELS